MFYLEDKKIEMMGQVVEAFNIFTMRSEQQSKILKDICQSFTDTTRQFNEAVVYK